LLEKVGKIGGLGETVKVRDGYGRNFLIPQGKALPATQNNREHFETQRAVFEERQQRVLASAQELAAKVEEVDVVLNRPAGSSEKLFGSVTNSDISDFYKENGLDIPRRDINVIHPIRTLGEHVVQVRLHPDVMPEVTVRVERSVRND
ncbi:MAG: 50S ribosomal protein L9, partial [Magnetococcales bacterium]|nr:50S ribosomal protein L9 [Magnetococcales bacterium]